MNFSAALFAGGRSSRMGSDKALLEIDGIPLWQRQLHTLQELHPTEIFLAGPVRPHWIESGLQIVGDVKADAGPLGGLVAVLRRCRTTRLLVLAIDLPRMPAAFLWQLLATSSDDVGIVPKRNGPFEPLAAVYSKHCLALAEGCLNAGEHSLQQFVGRAIEARLLAEREIVNDEESFFFNLNSPADFAAIASK